MANQKSGVHTEVDIVRHIVKDLIESYANEQDHNKRLSLFGKPPVRSSSEDKEDQHDQKKQVFKLYMRIWITVAR